MFDSVPFMDKWISTLVENYIYSTVREYYPCGSLNYEYRNKYTIRDGELKCWHRNGQLRVQGTIIGDKLYNYISFYKNGQPRDQSI